MIRIGFFVLFLIICFTVPAQQRAQGIKLLVKDKIVGNNIIDSVIVTFNDSIKLNAVADAGGYYFFSLPVGNYSIGIARKNYYGYTLKGIIVGEGKTAYVTMEIEKIQDQKKTKKKKSRKK